ncbi:hypothetical protein [Methanolobus sp. ZRKC5]|uniref:hypothetical protein n=1 Tax=unclassified Methanolobus TaxID=2629569 RepID=UPI00313B0A79
MSKISLSPYIIKIRQKYSAEDEDISDLFGTGTSLIDIIKDSLIKYSKKPFLEDTSKKALKFESLPKLKQEDTEELDAENEEDAIKSKVFLEKIIAEELGGEIGELTIIQSLVYYGEYGIIRSIMDTKTGAIDAESIDSEKTPVFDMTFTYFQDQLIRNKGYLIAQTYSGKGYKTILTHLIKSELNELSDEDIIVEIKPLMCHQLADIVQREDRITDIIFVSQDVSRDEAEKALPDGNYEIDIDNLKNFNLSLSASKNKSLVPYDKLEKVTSSLKKAFSNTRDTPFYEITNSELKQIKVKISTHKKEFTVGITYENLDFRESYAFEDDDVINSNGRIAHRYIANKAKEYSVSIASRYR